MGDAILVSFCNVAAPQLPLLAQFNPDSEGLLPIRLPQLAGIFKGITGLTQCDRHIYAVAQFRPREPERFTSRSALLVFRRDTLELITTYECRIAADGHSVTWVAGRIYIVSSGTDEIVELAMKGPEVVAERPYLQSAQGQRSDMRHLNGLCSSPDGMIMTAFGLRTDPSWSSATNGFIFNVNRREVLKERVQHPHSPFILDRSIVFCESRRMAVATVTDDRRQSLPGYTRGICRWGDDICVGTSVGRKTSRSTGQIVENPGVTGVSAGGCSISRLSASDFRHISTFETPLPSGEIYDLMTVEGGDDWPIDRRTLHETAITI